MRAVKNSIMKFVLASNNKKKISELRRIIEGIAPSSELCSLSDIGYTDEIVEDGDSFAANALIKAKTAVSLGYIGIADDSGICVDALGGAPGIYSARYSGATENADEKNNEKLLYELRNTPKEARGAHYTCVIACVFPQETGISPIICEGKCFGSIVFSGEERGEGGFGYDPLFLSADYEGKTMAELTAEEKDRVSHRGRALREFAEKIKPVLEEYYK